MDQYADPKTKYLRNSTNLIFTFKSVPFFNRFNKETIAKLIPRCKVEYFKQEDVIFLLGRVGIVTSGSLRVMNHDADILSPETIGRYKAGRIIGHGETDNNITTHSQTWILSFDDMTEVVFLEKEVFDELWIHLKVKYSEI